MPAKPMPLTRAALKDFPLPKVEQDEKNSRGRLLIIAGNRELAGAALLCATAAMRSGCGKLKIATAQSHAVPVSTAMPEARVIAIPESKNGGLARSAIQPLSELANSVDAVVAGPGMMPNAACSALARQLCGSSCAIAFDAGLLRSLPAAVDQVRRAKSPAILLPHADEMASLLDCSAEEVEADPLEHGRACAERYGAVTLVKGPRSHVVAPDGRAWLFEGGSPGLGVSGSGDTLAGIVGGLLARGADPLTALLWSVLLHGEAGARLSQSVGQIGFLAREIPDQIPALLDRKRAAQ